MTRELLHLCHGDSAAAHDLFHNFVPLTFRRVDFRLWQSRGGWDDSYEVFLLREGGEIVASTGCTRLQLCVAGQERAGWQLGAVAVHPQRRGQGHARILLQQVLERVDAEQAPVLLFANDNVLDFYPRFGFRPLAQRRYAAAVDWQPATAAPEPCDVSQPDDRVRLQALCENALLNDALFGVRRYYRVLLWHLCYRPLRACWLDDGNALAVVEESEGVLYLRDLLARRPFDLAAALPTLARAAVTRLEFGFRPQAWWPAAQDAGHCPDAPLFVRGMDDLHATHGLHFPDLAQT